VKLVMVIAVLALAGTAAAHIYCTYCADATTLAFHED
jgi:hypothetical protein